MNIFHIYKIYYIHRNMYIFCIFVRKLFEYTSLVKKYILFLHKILKEHDEADLFYVEGNSIS